MRKKLLAVVSALGLSLILCLAVTAPARVLAVDVVEGVCTNNNATEQPTICKDNATNAQRNPIFGPNSILSKVINILSVLVGVISVFVVIICALKLMTSMGDPTGVATARGGIIYAAIAILITVLSQVVVRLLLSKL